MELHSFLDTACRPDRVASFRAAALLALTSLLSVGCETKCPPDRLLHNGVCRAVTLVDDGASTPDGGGAADAGSEGSSSIRTAENAATAAAGTGASAGSLSGTAGDGSMPVAPAAGSGGAMSGAMSACPAGMSSTDEDCDGQDNDCDGTVDEGLADAACGSSTQGECRQGTRTCEDGAWTECAGSVEPVPEACDAAGLDENCDGMSNEGCACTPGETQECGVAMGACRKGMQTCSPDAVWGTDCDGAVQPQAEICDGKADDDCDDLPDDQDTDCQCLNGSMEPCMGGSVLVRLAVARAHPVSGPSARR